MRMQKITGKRTIGITTVLSAAIVGLVLLSTGLVLVLSSQIAWRNTIDLLRAQAELAMMLIEEEIRNHVTPALEISRYLHTQVSTGQVNPANRSELIAVLKGALAAAPQIAGVALWDENLRQMEVRRWPSGRVSVSYDQDQNTPGLVAMIENARRRGVPSWGPPNEGDDEENYVYTLTPLDHRGQHWGVMAVGVTVNNLTAIVKRISEQRGMTAFILYGDYYLAHPALDKLPVVIGEDGTARLRKINEVDDPIVAQFYQSEVVNNPAPGEVEIREIYNATDDQDYLVLSRANHEFGDTPWQIGIYGLSETLGMHLNRLISSFAVGVVVLLLAIGYALWIARKISRPIRKLAGSAEKIGMLDLANVGNIAPSRIKELDEQASAFNRMVEGLRWFETYVPKRLVRTLIHGHGTSQDGSVASQEMELSVMFTDIIGFTALSQTMPPGDVGKMLNAHFEIIARCIEAEGGTLDKYIGDAVMAFWGAPEAQPDHAQRACRAALSIADALDAAAKDYAYAADAADAMPAVRIKIAIHSGPLLVGNIGASSRMNYTVIGDTVNTCSRIESLCAKFDDGAPAVILVSADTSRLAAADATLQFESVGQYEVKGRSGEVHVSRLRRGRD